MRYASTSDGALESGEDVMMCEGTKKDFETLYAFINDSAWANRGIIPADRWNEPPLSQKDLQAAPFHPCLQY